MTKLTEVRQALRAALAGIDNTGVKVGAAAGDYLQPVQQFTVCVLVGAPSETAEARLDELLAPEGPDSVKAALEGQTAVDGDIHVAKHSGYRVYVQPGQEQALGAEWTVDALI